MVQLVFPQPTPQALQGRGKLLPVDRPPIVLVDRVKEDVEKSLPPKEETILEVSLTPIQKQFYKAIYEKNTSFLFKGTKPSNAPSLMNVMMELRKCCNVRSHYYLFFRKLFFP